MICWLRMSRAVLVAGALTLCAPLVHAADKDRGLRAFAAMMKVMAHPRCLNCHQDTHPRVRTGRRIHLPRLKIGDDGFGVGGNRCSICHSDENNLLTRIPGAAGWRMPPYTMSWNGLQPGDICENIKDKEMNGGRDLAGLIDHLEHDTLVIWAWSPGTPRQPAPTSHREFVDLTRAWVASGAPCPPTTDN